MSESLSLAMQLAGVDPAEVYYGKLERRKTKIPDLHSNYNEAPTSVQQRTGSSRGNPVRFHVFRSKDILADTVSLFSTLLMPLALI